jgi:uncharacterized protein (TIGR02265 family)
VTPQPQAQKNPWLADELIFEHVVDGLLKGIGARRTPRIEERLLEAGWGGPKKKVPAYPHATWRTFLRISREELFPNEEESAGYTKLGAMFSEGYFQTALGSAVAALARLLGPKRTLIRATQQFRSANNFTQTKVTELAPNHYQLWMNSIDQKDFVVGIIRRGLEIGGAKDVRVVAQLGEGNSCTFEISWT